jgi:hypothetical protein
VGAKWPMSVRNGWFAAAPPAVTAAADAVSLRAPRPRINLPMATSNVVEFGRNLTIGYEIDRSRNS